MSYHNPIEKDRYGRQLYPIICADCGQSAKVPFKPNPERPVYCPTCFAARRAKREWNRK